MNIAVNVEQPGQIVLTLYSAGINACLAASKAGTRTYKNQSCLVHGINSVG